MREFTYYLGQEFYVSVGGHHQFLQMAQVYLLSNQVPKN